jgi:multisubunit Na+/H+ antiporter MnhB subunit
MIAGVVFDLLLAAMVLGVAWWVVAAHDAFAAVVGFVVLGLLLALAWVRLDAVDVALTEAAIGGGFTGAALVAAALRLRPGEAAAAGEQVPVALRQWAAGLSFLVAAAVAMLVLLLPNPPPTLAPAAGVHLEALGLGNPVTAVLLAYRAFDTLLEKVVVLLALYGVWSLAPDALWGGAARAQHEGPVGGPLALLGLALPPVGVLVAVYLLWAGASEPGGAFQGGAVLGAMGLLAMLAGLRMPPETGARAVRWVLVAGPALFMAVGLAGFVVADGFLAYPPAIAKALIIAVELVLMLSIGVLLALLVAGPAARAPRR